MDHVSFVQILAQDANFAARQASSEGWTGI